MGNSCQGRQRWVPLAPCPVLPRRTPAGAQHSDRRGVYAAEVAEERSRAVPAGRYRRLMDRLEASRNKVPIT
jgi:hypothetical protein